MIPVILRTMTAYGFPYAVGLARCRCRANGQRKVHEVALNVGIGRCGRCGTRPEVVLVDDAA